MAIQKISDLPVFQIQKMSAYLSNLSKPEKVFKDRISASFVELSYKISSEADQDEGGQAKYQSFAVPIGEFNDILNIGKSQNVELKTVFTKGIEVSGNVNVSTDTSGSGNFQVVTNNLGLSGNVSQISGKDQVQIKSDNTVNVQANTINLTGVVNCDNDISSNNQLVNKSYVDSNVPLFNTVSLDYRNPGLSSECGYVLLSSGQGAKFSKGQFPKVYEHLKQDLSGSSGRQDIFTVLSNGSSVPLTVDYLLANDGHKILSAEYDSDKVQAIVGVSGGFKYYTVLTAEEKFILPSVSAGDGYVYMRCV